MALQFPDDPPLHWTRPLPQFDNELIGALLKDTANHLAPGESGYTWTLIKWAWGADPDCIANLLRACITAGHHPKIWKVATVCVIPKPNRADYTLAKNFCPISLLKCLGKLLEKLIAKLIYKEMVVTCH